MDMRYLESVHVNHAAAHILDKRLEGPMLGILEMELTEDLHEFLMKHTLRAVRSDDSQKATFVGDGAVKALIRGIFSDESLLVENSQELAKRLFSVMRSSEAVLSGDMAVILFRSGEARFLGILKLDYQKSFTHEIEYVADKFDVRLISQDIGLPLTHQRLAACAFIKEDCSDNSYDLLVSERETGEEGPRYFLHRFLGAERVLDKRDRTKSFRRTVEQWTRKNLKNDFAAAEQVRAQLNEELLGSAYIDVEAFSEELFSRNSDAKEKFDKRLETAGLRDGEKIEVDRLWVTTKMKNKTLKTDTGFILRAEHEMFDDPARFEMRRNGDGSVDYIIKNVRNISER